MMAAKKKTIGKRKQNTPRAKSQQRTRRRDSLFRKAFEYCCQCDADISLMVRLKHNGQTFVFNSNSRWPVVQEDVVGVYHQNKEEQLLTAYQFLQYPTPKIITWQDLAARYNDGTNEPKQSK
jgi:hypothetical protein